MRVDAHALTVERNLHLGQRGVEDNELVARRTLYGNVPHLDRNAVNRRDEALLVGHTVDIGRLEEEAAHGTHDIREPNDLCVVLVRDHLALLQRLLQTLLRHAARENIIII